MLKPAVAPRIPCSISQAGLQRRAQVLHPLHQVVHVDVVRVDVDVAEAPAEQRHRLDAVVDPPLQHALVAHGDAALEQLVHRRLGDRRDLARVVEVGVEHDLLVAAAPLLHDPGQRVRPGVVGQDLLRHHRRSLGRVAHPPDVVDRQQRLADLRDLLGPQLVRVAARDDDVLQLGPRADVVERLLPALHVHLELELRHLFRVDADRVAARAEAAVDRAGVERAGTAPCRRSGGSDPGTGMSTRSCSESRSRRGWSGSRRDASGMNCRRSGSRSGLLQSISDSRYGDTRTDIGARSKPSLRRRR